MSNRYEIREQIGKGGLGAVYKAFDTQLQREVAIKRVLAPGKATDEEVQDAADNLIAEAQTLSCLNHPNIITVFDVGQDDQGGFVVMELLKGETLDETIERGVLTQADFVEVVLQAMEALIAAQAINVIHRDIKPTNIMVIWQASGKFQIKILDFGLAKFSKSPSVQTMDQEDSVLGSIFFMSPEQFERGELDARTDLYQMGCVFYNALTGQYPFNGETAPQVMNAHLQHKVVPLEQVRPDLSPSICQWVMWLINRDIEHRPLDAKDALKRWPRDPEPPGAIPVQALPVEDTPDVATGEIRIVTAASQAYAPPSLIVGPSPGGSGPIRRANLNRSSKEVSGKTKMIATGAVFAVILVIIGIIVAGSVSNKNKEKRITELAAAEKVVGTVSDVDAAVSVLKNGKSSAKLKDNAVKVLSRLEGSGIDEKILEELKKAESTSLRIQLSKAISERGYAKAFTTITKFVSATSSEDQKIQLLGSIRSLATPDNLEDLLATLQTERGLAARKYIEDTALAVLYKSNNPEPAIEKILTRVSASNGDERKSLFRILGAMGTDKVKARLGSIYNQKSDSDYQRDAMIGYLNWKDRSVIPDVEKIINETKDTGLRSVAEKALARLVTLPGSESLEEKIATWDRAAGLIKNPNDIRRMVGAVIGYPSPKTLALLRKWSKNNDLKNTTKAYLGSMEKLIAAVKPIAPGEDLAGNRARVQGDKKASFDSSLGSITKWASRETWFSWTFKVTEAGNYSIEVDQASLNDDSSDFEVSLLSQNFTGKSVKTNSLKDFKTIALKGTVSLEPETIYTLVLMAGDHVQPQMMDIRSVRLVK